ncbi:YueI family protein [Weissella viridescens]|nr:YueI family protein [Weissella viridescens]
MTELDPHLQNAMYGTPEVNPDEQHHYLGTFKERVYKTQQMATVGDSKYLTVWDETFQKHPDGVLLLNGRLDADATMPYMQLAKKDNVDFRLVSDPMMTATDLGVVFTADHAVHSKQLAIEDADLNEPAPTPKKEPEKQSWFKKLFS